MNDEALQRAQADAARTFSEYVATFGGPVDADAHAKQAAWHVAERRVTDLLTQDSSTKPSTRSTR